MPTMIYKAKRPSDRGFRLSMAFFRFNHSNSCGKSKKKKMASRRDSYNQDQGQGQHVLLTGANGFVASHILLRLLEVHTLNKAHPWISKNSTD